MRNTEVKKLDSVFIERWSPRSFASDPIPQEDITTVFEAARWSPSCYNEQPWRFVYASQADDLSRFRAALVDSNQVWANKAPLLVYLFSKKTFSHNGKVNRWADFDAGAAWMALTLQANRLGLYTHAMGGFDEQKAFAVTGVDPEEYNVLCAIAIGKMADPGELPENIRKNETPNSRKPLHELVYEAKR